MIEYRGVKINGNKIDYTNLKVWITNRLIIQVGKYIFENSDNIKYNINYYHYGENRLIT